MTASEEILYSYMLKTALKLQMMQNLTKNVTICVFVTHWKFLY